MLFLAFVAIALVSLPTPSTSQGAVLPLSYPPRVINSTQQACPQGDVREGVRNAIIQDIRNATRNTIIPSLCLLGQNRDYPAASCSEIPTSCSSGQYWVRSSNGTAVQVYCDLNRVCGCSSTGSGGWTRVINVNYNDPSQPCPGEWFPLTYSTEPTRLCGRTGSSASCVSALFSTYGIRYRHVCGRVIGFADESPDAFGHGVGQSIEGAYVDGVSLTHGPPGARQHIWTFAAGLLETVHPTYPLYSCPCVGSGTASPSFVGENYFCESGNSGSGFANVLYASDPLWDGQGCGNPPCCDLDSGPPGVTAPWFCRQLPQDTSDDLEVRICGSQDTTDEDTPLQLVELYIR